jgi:hypothetical protein
MLTIRLFICRFILFLSEIHLRMATTLAKDAQEMFQNILNKYFSDERR